MQPTAVPATGQRWRFNQFTSIASLTHAAMAAAAAVIFVAFTWRAPLMFFSGDDMMNMYKAWRTTGADLVTSCIAFWIPAFRPLGGLVYHIAYSIFGFHPGPLYAFSWAILIVNTGLLYALVAQISRTTFHPLVACVIATVHGMYLDLYYSAGTIYDHLSALFCFCALLLWMSVRLAGRTPGMAVSFGVVLLTALGVDSKENAVVIPVLLVAAELLFAGRRDGTIRRARLAAPLLASALVAIFFIVRIHRTADLAANPLYRPQITPAAFAANFASYVRQITYSSAIGDSAAIGALCAMAAITAVIRSRVLIFGFVWFCVTLLPVVFIAARSGYALYLPMMGLGLWFAEALYRLLTYARTPRAALPACAAVVAAGLGLFHARHWGADWTRETSPEWITAREFRLRYPHLPHGARFLFITDPYPRDAYDLLFTLKLMYGDDDLVADRVLSGNASQRPASVDPLPRYDHIFRFRAGYYTEYVREWVNEALLREGP